MKIIQIKIKIILATLVLALVSAGSAQAATTIYSPANNSTATTGQNVTFYWYNSSIYNYISIWNGSWGAWQNLGKKYSYSATRNSPGYLGAQVATWENNKWQYSNVVWVYFNAPVPPPPPPPPAPGAPNLSRSPNDPVYKGDTVTFNWNKPGNTTDFYIAYRRDNVWDASWTWVGLSQNQAFNQTVNLSNLAAQVAACNSSGCGYSNVPAVNLLAKTPSQMNLTPLTSGSFYNRSLNSASDIKYEKITNATGGSQVYSAKMAADTANTTISAVDGAGNPSNVEAVSFNQGYMALKVAPGQDRYLKFTGTKAGNYSFSYNRFRNFLYFEGQ